MLISRQYRRHFPNQREILYILVMSKIEKTQKQYFAFLGPFCPFLDNIVVIFTMSAKFSTFWSCQTSISTHFQKIAFLGSFYSFLDNIVVIFTISAKFRTFWYAQTSISTNVQKITFFGSILPLFIGTKICMQIYVSIPNVLRRPKYKLSKRY